MWLIDKGGTLADLNARKDLAAKVYALLKGEPLETLRRAEKDPAPTKETNK
jgi:hypothetical protein